MAREQSDGYQKGLSPLDAVAARGRHLWAKLPHRDSSGHTNDRDVTQQNSQGNSSSPFSGRFRLSTSTVDDDKSSINFWSADALPQQQRQVDQLPGANITVRHVESNRASVPMSLMAEHDRASSYTQGSSRHSRSGDVSAASSSRVSNHSQAPSVSSSSSSSHSFQEAADQWPTHSLSRSPPAKQAPVLRLASDGNAQDESSSPLPSPTFANMASPPGVSRQKSYNYARPMSAQSNVSQSDSIMTRVSVNFSRPLRHRRNGSGGTASPALQSPVMSASEMVPEHSPVLRGISADPNMSALSLDARTATNPLATSSPELRRASTFLLGEIRDQLKHVDRPSAPRQALAALSPSPSRIPPHESRESSMTDEDHVSRGIQLHQDGHLPQSFHHLQVAANRGNPTGQLLYALALRHGWGCAPNQKESVIWLQRAADHATENLAMGADKADVATELKNKQTRAQIGLAIFELGVCYMKGWGAEKDKAMGLRCFEISAGWGDADASNECGNCYVRGIGTKKDPRKAARYFRQAESLGLYTPGNTWIHKAKYDDAVDEGTASPNRFDGARRLFRRRPLRQASATQVTPAPSSPRATAR